MDVVKGVQRAGGGVSDELAVSTRRRRPHRRPPGSGLPGRTLALTTPDLQKEGPGERTVPGKPSPHLALPVPVCILSIFSPALGRNPGLSSIGVVPDNGGRSQRVKVLGWRRGDGLWCLQEEREADG